MNELDLRLAVLSGAAYRQGRKRENFVPFEGVADRLVVPPQYALDPRNLLSGGTGFEASVYRLPSGKIAIAFAGTETSQFEDIKADLMLAVGKVDGQLLKAAELYTWVKQTYGNDIVFTGHSLCEKRGQVLPFAPTRQCVEEEGSEQQVVFCLAGRCLFLLITRRTTVPENKQNKKRLGATAASGGNG